MNMNMDMMMVLKEEEHPKVKPSLPDPTPHFVEVLCKSSGKTRRFAAGTEASFAVAVINNKLDGGSRVWHIEAVKNGEEEPIAFGPHSVLVEYGNGWRLQTVFEPEGFRKKGVPFMSTTPTPTPPPTRSKDPNASSPPNPTTMQSNMGFTYMAKILLAFVLIFIMGAAFTFALENLPRLILYINSL